MGLTGWFIVGAIIVIVGYDIYAYVKGGVEQTISKWIYEKSGDYRIIPFAMGMLVAHLLNI